MASSPPNERSRSERKIHFRTNVLLAIVMAAFVGGTGRYLGEPPLEEEQKKEELEPDSQTLLKAARRKWQRQIERVAENLPPLHSDTMITLQSQLDRALKHLNAIGPKLSDPSMVVTNIEQRLITIEQQAARLNRIASTQADVVDPTPIEAAAKGLLDEEATQIKDATEKARQLVRDKLEPQIRKARLKLRDAQDKTAGLRQEINMALREQAQIQAKEARSQLLQRDMADVRKYLSSFITPGYLQPEIGSNPWNTERTVDAQPVSLTRLQQSGALDRTMKGLRRLYIFGGGKNPGLHNSRPLGAFPQFAAEQLHKPQIRDPVDLAQKLLIQHGQALVEVRLLSP